MPVSRLLVEGNLDREILSAVMAGSPVVDGGPNPKPTLGPRTRDFRNRTPSVFAVFIQDRDFDQHPPVDLSTPTIDQLMGTDPIGWRWCRTEIENYLIDPQVIAVALGWDVAGFTQELIRSAESIRFYQIARWTVAELRKAMPPLRNFPTKPAECDRDFKTPADLSESSLRQWVDQQASDFSTNVQNQLSQSTISTHWREYSLRFTPPFPKSVEDCLLWFSGKDLLAGMMTWLQATYKRHPTQVIETIRDWIIQNPEEMIRFFPEWDAFRNHLRTAP